MNSDICSHLPLQPAWSCCFPVFRDAAIHHHVTPCRHLWNMTKFKRAPPLPPPSIINHGWAGITVLGNASHSCFRILKMNLYSFPSCSTNISYFRPVLFLPSSWLSRQPLPSCPQFIEAWCCLRFTFCLKNIARIANAVQVTICLLVSTSVN